MKTSTSILIAIISIFIGYLLSCQKVLKLKDIKEKLRKIEVQNYFKFPEKKIIENECASENLINLFLAKPFHKKIDENLKFVGEFCEKIDCRVVKNASEEKWDVLWATDYLFDRFPDKIRYQPLEPHQIVNHIPGMTFLTNKLYLSTSTISKYIPSSFTFPTLKNEFLYFVKTKPDAFYVQKTYDSKEIKVLSYEQIDFGIKSWVYIQELVPSPLLIDGHAFDIGVYVLITSIKPLRIYRWNYDILLRFCNKEYDPFDQNIIEKVNCAINSKEPSEMPSLKMLINDLKFSNVDALNNYLENNDYTPSNLWNQIDDAISTIILQKSHLTKRYVNSWKEATNNRMGKSFELLKFDFVIDKELKVHLIEIDMSPNLIYKGIDKERKTLMAERLLKDTFGIIGAGNYAELIEKGTSTMTSSPRNIAVDIDLCTSQCSSSCEDLSCDLCLPCIKDEKFIEILHQSYKEHQRRGDFKRIFPTTRFQNDNQCDDCELEDDVKLLKKWFEKKCEIDQEFC